MPTVCDYISGRVQGKIPTCKAYHSLQDALLCDLIECYALCRFPYGLPLIRYEFFIYFIGEQIEVQKYAILLEFT
jgi:hypothetical protein